MAAAVCRQCGAQSPSSAGEGSESIAKRCRFCGQAYEVSTVGVPPPPAAAVGRPVLGQAPPRHKQPPVASLDRPKASEPPWRQSAVDPLSLPFDVDTASDVASPSPPRRRRLPLVLALVVAAGVVGTILRPVQMGLSPDWLQALLGKRVDPLAQKALQEGLLALDRGSARGLIEAKHSFEQALKIDDHYALAFAGLAETELAMAQALGDAAADMAHFSQGLGRKDMRRAQHEADTQRLEAKWWATAATPAAQMAVQLAPNTPAANRVMAELLRQQADVKGAVAWSEGGHKSIAEDAGMLVVKADLMGPQDLSGACTALRQALVTWPTNNRARLKLAQYLLRKKDVAHALEAVQSILAAAPENELAQQLLMRLQPAQSQADKVQRPLVLTFATEMHLDTAAGPVAAAHNDSGQSAPVLPPPAVLDDGQKLAAGAAAAAFGDGATPGDDEVHSIGPPMTFLAQAKVSIRNIWQSFCALVSSNNEVPAPVAPSDLGADMPAEALPVAPVEAPTQVPAPADKSAAPAQTAAAARLRSLPHADGAFGAAAPASQVVGAAPAAQLPAEVQRMDTAQLLQQADALRAQQHADRALPLYQLAAKRAPQQMAGLLGIGYTQLDLGEQKSAADAFNQALRLSSWQAEPHFGLAQALQGLGQSREAVAHYRRYLAIEPNGPHAAVARQMLEELSK